MACMEQTERQSCGKSFNEGRRDVSVEVKGDLEKGKWDKKLQTVKIYCPTEFLKCASEKQYQFKLRI